MEHSALSSVALAKSVHSFAYQRYSSGFGMRDHRLPVLKTENLARKTNCPIDADASYRPAVRRRAIGYSPTLSSSRSRPSITIAGVAQRQSSALIRRRSVVQVNPPAPAFAASRLRLASQPRGVESCPPKLQPRQIGRAHV